MSETISLTNKKPCQKILFTVWSNLHLSIILQCVGTSFSFNKMLTSVVYDKIYYSHDYLLMAISGQEQSIIILRI